MLIRRLVNILIYQFSTSKQTLDSYMKDIRMGKQLSDSDVTKLKQLIEYEKLVYGR